VDLDAIVIDERPGLVLPESRTPAIATPVPVQRPRRVEPPRAHPLGALGAAFYLNLGATNVARASIGADRPKEERERLLEDADRWLKEAMDRDPGNLGVYRNVAASAAAASESGRARRALQDAEEIADPEDERFYFQAGRIYRDIGDTERAIAAWTRAGAVPQMIQWGAALVRRGQWKNAADVNLAAVRLAPGEASAYRALVSAVSRQRGDDAALTQMMELSAVYPDMPWPYLEAGDLLAKMNRPAEAQTWYSRALTVAPNESTVRQRAAGR
jgi:tetratricopeptide (TPR) repeat protein